MRRQEYVRSEGGGRRSDVGNQMLGKSGDQRPVKFAALFLPEISQTEGRGLALSAAVGLRQNELGIRIVEDGTKSFRSFRLQAKK